MDCESCLNLQESGLCGVYGKEPPEGFAARCLRYAERPAGLRTPADSPTRPAAGSPLGEGALNASLFEGGGGEAAGGSSRRLCLAEYCPFLVTELPGTYCMARILPDRTEYLALEEETPCPRDWTI